MMKNKHLFARIIKSLAVFVCFFYILSVSGCTQITEENQIVSDGFAKLSFSVADYDSDDSSGRFAMPSAMDTSVISKVKLSGVNQDDASDTPVSETYTSYSDFLAASLSVHENSWKFDVEIYSDVSGSEELIGTASTTLNVIANRLNKISFNIVPQGTGFYEFTIKYPAGQASSVSYSFMGGATLSVQSSTTSGGYTVDIIKGSASSGSAVLKSEFKNASGGTTFAGMEAVYIAGGRTTKATYTYKEINTSYDINYDLSYAVGTPAPVLSGSELTKYNATKKVVLPVAADFTTIPTGMQFDGWFLASDFSGTPVTGWLPGVRKESLTFYAKFSGAHYPIAVSDKNTFTGFSGKSYSVTEHVYGVETILSAPQHVYSGSENSIIFGGWYTNMGCTTPVAQKASGEYYLPATTEPSTPGSSLHYYASWDYKKIYINTLTGDDYYVRGFRASLPFKTVSYALGILKSLDLQTDKSIVLLNTIDDAANISGINGVYSSTVPVSIERGSGNTGYLIDLTPEAISQLSDGLRDTRIINETPAYNSVHIQDNITFGGTLYLGNVSLDKGKVITVNYTLTSCSPDGNGLVAILYPESYDLSGGKIKILQNNTGGKPSAAEIAMFKLSDSTNYMIDEDGYLAEKGSGDLGLTPALPGVTELPLGSLAKGYLKLGDSSGLKIVISDETYNAIKLNGTDKKVSYQIIKTSSGTVEGSGDIPITGTPGNYSADILFLPMNYSDLGNYTLLVTAESEAADKIVKPGNLTFTVIY